MQIQGGTISLIPLSSKDRDRFYELATQSYGSQFWYDNEEKGKRSKKAFFEDWTEGYFDIEKPNEGQCFWIVAQKKRIGTLCYNRIDKHSKKTELDIIIGDKNNLSKGYGTDAIKTLVKYLFEKFGLNKVWIEVRSNNSRAINAYQKAGFKKEGILKEEDYFQGEYVDCVRLGILRKDWVV